MVNDATVVLGAQTNDSNLFLFRDYTKDAPSVCACEIGVRVSMFASCIRTLKGRIGSTK